MVHVDDITDACVYFMKKKKILINIGTVTIKFYLE